MGTGSSRLNDRAIQLYLNSVTPKEVFATRKNNKGVANVKTLPKDVRKNILQLINKNPTLKKAIYHRAKNQLNREKYQKSKTWKNIEKRQANSTVSPMPPASSITRKNNATNNASVKNALMKADKIARNLANIRRTSKQMGIQPNTTPKYMNGRTNSYILKAARELVESQAPEGLAGEDLDNWIEDNIYSRLELGAWSNINNDNTRKQLMGYKKSLFGRKSNQNRSNAAKVAAYGLKSALTVADPNSGPNSIYGPQSSFNMSSYLSGNKGSRFNRGNAKKNPPIPKKLLTNNWTFNTTPPVSSITVNGKNKAPLSKPEFNMSSYLSANKGTRFNRNKGTLRTKTSTNGSTNSTAPLILPFSIQRNEA